MKNFRGDVRLWTDGQQAYARIEAQTTAGPISLRASAPLAAIRDQVVRALAARGISFYEGDPDVETVVGYVGRWGALKRLRSKVHRLARKVSPAHALASRLAANPALRRLVQQAIPAGALAAQFVPGLGPAAVAARMALQRLQSRGVPVPVPGLAPAASEDEVQGLGLGELLEGAAPVPSRPAAVPPKVRAAGALLRAARTRPEARAKVKKIVSLAKAGNPRGASAYQALQVAKAVSQSPGTAVAPRRAPLAAVQAVRSASARTLPLAPAPAAPVVPTYAPPVVTPRAPAVVPPRRGFDLFHYWRRGVE